MQIKLHAGSLCGKFLGMNPPDKKYCGGTAYIVTIEDEKLRFDMYCEDILLEIITNDLAIVTFSNKDYFVKYRKIKNSLHAAMDACGFT